MLSKFRIVLTKESIAYFDGVEELLGKAGEEAERSFKDIAGKALKDTLAAPFRGEMDKIEDIWEGAWDHMAERLDHIWQDLLGGLAEKGLDKLEKIGYEVFVKPVEDWFAEMR